MSAPVLDADSLTLIDKVVGWIVRRDAVAWHDSDDMRQDAWIGLDAARRSFDVSRRVPFASYAWHRMSGAIWDGRRHRAAGGRRAHRNGLAPHRHIKAGEDFAVRPLYVADVEWRDSVRVALSRLQPWERDEIQRQIADGWEWPASEVLKRFFYLVRADMLCEHCQSETKVIDSRMTSEGTKRRRRVCPRCNGRFTTYEVRVTEPKPAAPLMPSFEAMAFMFGSGK